MLLFMLINTKFKHLKNKKYEHKLLLIIHSIDISMTEYMQPGI